MQKKIKKFSLNGCKMMHIFHMRVMFFSNIPIISLSFLILSIQSCGLYKDQLAVAQGFENRGDFEASLLEYKHLNKSFSNRFEVKAGLGRLYSLKRATIFAGLDYIKRAYNQKKDKKLWKDLLLLYLSMEQYTQALGLLQEPNVDLEELFSPELIGWRAGIICLNRPTYTNIKNVENLQTFSRRNYFLVLCLLKTKSKSLKSSSLLIESWEKLSQDSQKTTCELLNIVPANSKIINIDIKAEQKKCRIKFPANIAIHRDHLNSIFSKITVPNKIFMQKGYTTLDPGRDDVPPWPGPRRMD